METIPNYDSWKGRAPEDDAEIRERRSSIPSLDETGTCSFCGDKLNPDDLEYNTLEGVAACQECVLKGLM